MVVREVESSTVVPLIHGTLDTLYGPPVEVAEYPGC